MTGNLFRPEVSARRSERLLGTVRLVTPVSWQVMALGLFATLVVAACFLWWGSYARIETAAGAIVADKGVSSVTTSRAGVIDRVLVADGQRVVAGQPLAVVRAEEDMTGGRTVTAIALAALHEEDRRLEEQSRRIADAANAERARWAAQSAGAEAEATAIEGQIGDQRRLIRAAEAAYADATLIQRRGFLSRRDLETRESALIERRQQFGQYLLQREARRATIATADRAQAQAVATAEASVAALSSRRAGIRRQLAEAELARGYTLTAPVGGRLTSFVAQVGSNVPAQQDLGTIVPVGATLEAHLQVTVAAIGFVRPGQRVRLALDSFPFQRFGTLDAVVSSVAQAGSSRTVGDKSETFYLVRARLARPWIGAYGRRQPLLPGMTLSARIATDRRTLLQVLFDPLISIGTR